MEKKEIFHYCNMETLRKYILLFPLIFFTVFFCTYANLEGTCTFTSENSTTFNTQVRNKFPIIAEGADFVVASHLPHGLYINNFESGEGGELRGIPTQTDSSIEELVLTAYIDDTNFVECGSQVFTLIIEASPCTFISTNSAHFYIIDPENTFSIRVKEPYAGEISITQGTLPEGVRFTDNGNGTALLSGQPGEDAEGCYQLKFQFVEGEGGCISTQDFLLVVNHSSSPQKIGRLCSLDSPFIISAKQKLSGNNLVGMGIRAKKDKSVCYKDVVKFKAPKRGATPAAFRVYTDKKLQHLVGEVQNLGQQQFRFVQRNVKACSVFHYYLVSVGEYGELSKPVKAKLKNAKQDCLINKKGHEKIRACDSRIL